MLLKWRVLTRDERVLLAAGTFWVLAAHAVLRAPGQSFPTKQRALDALAARLPKLPATTLPRAAWAVTASAKRIPKTVCLPWALALRGLLTQLGLPSQLRIGVAADGGTAASSSRKLKAHAWVDCQGRSLTWNEVLDDYTVLAQRLDTETETATDPSAVSPPP